MQLSTIAPDAPTIHDDGVRIIQDLVTWNSVVNELVGGNILQSYQWGQFKSRFGWQPLRVAQIRGGRPVAAAQVLLRPSPLGQLAYVPRGPLVVPEDDGVLPGFLDVLHGLLRARGAFSLKIEPEWPDSRALNDRLRSLGFRAGNPVQPRSTIILNLHPDLGALSASLSPRTRYNVGLGGRRGVEVVAVGDDTLGHFYQLLEATSRRSHFSIHPFEYYQGIWEELAAHDLAHLLVARYQGEILSVVLILTMGTSAYYMYGGSSESHRNLKPSDLLQWEAIRWARERGCVSYDFWGIPDEVGRQVTAEGSEIDPAEAQSRDLWGVYHFKRGFGGQPVRYVGAHDYVYSSSRFWLWRRLVPRLRALARRRRP